MFIDGTVRYLSWLPPILNLDTACRQAMDSNIAEDFCITSFFLMIWQVLCIYYDGEILTSFLDKKKFHIIIYKSFVRFFWKKDIFPLVNVSFNWRHPDWENSSVPSIRAWAALGVQGVNFHSNLAYMIGLPNKNIYTFLRMSGHSQSFYLACGTF